MQVLFQVFRDGIDIAIDAQHNMDAAAGREGFQLFEHVFQGLQGVPDDLEEAIHIDILQIEILGRHTAKEAIKHLGAVNMEARSIDKPNVPLEAEYWSSSATNAMVPFAVSVQAFAMSNMSFVFPAPFSPRITCIKINPSLL